MQTAAIRSSIGLSITLAIILGLMYIATTVPVVGTNGAASVQAAPVGESQAGIRPPTPTEMDTDMLAGIIFAGSITDQDKAYLRDSLQLLHDRLPAWWQYIMDARPFALAVDLVQGQHGRAAITQCCNVPGFGSITFGLHFGQLTASDDADSQAPAARQITFLGVLMHEVTHVRDQRSGRFSVKTDRKSCVAAETSGLTRQLEFKRDLSAQTTAGDPAAEAYASWLNAQVESEARDLHSRAFWDLYCGGMD